MPDPDRWVGKGISFWPDKAAYRALFLLYRFAHDEYDALPTSVFARSAATIVHWPRLHEHVGTFDRDVRERTNSVAPDEFAATINRRLEVELEQRGRASLVVDESDELWSSQLEALYLSWIGRRGLEPGVSGELVRALHRHGCKEVKSAVAPHVSVEVVADQEGQAIAIELCNALVETEPDAAWDLVWPLIVGDAALGPRLVERLASIHGGPVPSKLNVHELEALFRWMAQEFPPEGDPEIAGPFTARMRISLWRESLVGAIVRQGDRTAVEVLAQLARDHPEFEWLPVARHQADEQRRRTEWIPPTPAEVVRLGDVKGSRYLANAVDLQALVVQALQSIKTGCTLTSRLRTFSGTQTHGARRRKTT